MKLTIWEKFNCTLFWKPVLRKYSDKKLEILIKIPEGMELTREMELMEHFAKEVLANRY